VSTESEYVIHPEQTELLTLPEAAQWAGVSLPTIRGWLRGGHLASLRVGSRRFIRTADLAATLATAYLDGVVPAWRADPPRAGWRLRAVREAAGLTQIALGDRSGLSHEFISRLETGQSWPGAGSIRVLAQSLGVEPEAFVNSDQMGMTLLTTAEAATRLDVPIERIQTWLNQGELAGRKVSGQWRVPARAVMELARSGRLRGRSRRLDPRYRG
jgi:excisionase family DNA binding protein